MDGTAFPKTTGTWNSNWYSNRNSCSTAHGAEINETKRYTKTPSTCLSTIYSSQTVPGIDFRYTLHVHKAIVELQCLLILGRNTQYKTRKVTRLPVESVFHVSAS